MAKKKLNMNLEPIDENKIDIIKKKYGLMRTSEVIRFCISNVYQQIIKKED